MFRFRAIDGEHFRLELTVDADFMERLNHAIDLDRHRNPKGDPVAILSHALDLQIASAEKRKYKVTDRPRSQASSDTEAVPAAVMRGVNERDGGRCTAVGKDGRVCGATAFIEYDHITPRVKGSGHSVEEGRLLCSQHNRRAAELSLGRAVVERAREREQKSRDARSALVHAGFSRRDAAALTREFLGDVDGLQVKRSALRPVAATTPTHEAAIETCAAAE